MSNAHDLMALATTPESIPFGLMVLIVGCFLVLAWREAKKDAQR